MRVLPILFNTEMVQAILDGRKTVTRRICKDGNDYVVPDMGFYDANKRTYAVHNYADLEHREKLSLAERACPICPGDILYVRETWFYECHMEDITAGEPDLPGGRYSHRYIYKADNPNYPVNNGVGATGWHPSIHMPKEAARIWLKVTDVRVERLQEIGVLDCQREGIDINRNGIFKRFSVLERCEKPESAG